MTREELQKEGEDIFLKEKRGILQLAQRSGKCKIAINIFRRLNNPRILICYPDNKIKLSWESELKKWDYKGDIAFFNYASIHKIEGEWDIVVWDEIHDTSERQKFYIDAISSKTKYVLGLSGTISKETKWQLEEINLRILMKYTVEEAIEDEIIAPYNIFIHTVNLDTLTKKKNSKGKLVSEKNQYDNYTYVINKNIREKRDVSFLAIHRNRILQNSLAKYNRTLYLINKHKEESILVFTGLKKIAESLNIPYYHSTSKNEEVFEDFKKGKIKHLSVCGIGKSGVTYENLDTIILNSFTGNEEVTEQLISRGQLRDTPDKVVNIHIITSSEEAEIKKLKKTLTNFNKNSISWI